MVDGLISHFFRTGEGVWVCTSFAEFNGPNGRIQVPPGARLVRGTDFMGFDLAEWLDREYRKIRRKAPSAGS